MLLSPAHVNNNYLFKLININIGYAVNVCKFALSKGIDPGNKFIPKDNQLIRVRNSF